MRWRNARALTSRCLDSRHQRARRFNDDVLARDSFWPAVVLSRATNTARPHEQRGRRAADLHSWGVVVLGVGQASRESWVPTALAPDRVGVRVSVARSVTGGGRGWSWLCAQASSIGLGTFQQHPRQRANPGNSCLAGKSSGDMPRRAPAHATAPSYTRDGNDKLTLATGTTKRLEPHLAQLSGCAKCGSKTTVSPRWLGRRLCR